MQTMSLPSEYLNAVVENDIPGLGNTKRNKKKIRALLHSLARNESTVVSNATLKKDMQADGTSIDPDTIVEYLDTLGRLFLIYEQPSFNINLRPSRRILKSPKRHFIDPSLAIASLSAITEMLLKVLNTFGFIFEALCEHDLKIYAECFGGKLYHYRDEKGNEIDAVIELPDGRWAAFEIKLGAHQIDAAAAQLLKIKGIMKREGMPPAAMDVICGISEYAYTREDGIHVVPITH